MRFSFMVLLVSLKSAKNSECAECTKLEFPIYVRNNMNMNLLNAEIMTRGRFTVKFKLEPY